MKQLLQSLKTGDTEILDIPTPQLQAGHVLIRTHCSLISSGTEKMLVDFGKASLIEKMRQQPDKVRMVIDKVMTDGLLPTIDAVRSKLDKSIAMGYCNVGTVIEVAQDVTQFQVGDRVVSNGSHAEVVCVPQNLCCKIPANVTDASASFAVLGAIALQGIRLANPTLGESFAVIGLGLIGLLTVQLLRANGCRVLAIDIDAQKTAIAAELGAEIVTLGAHQDIDAIANRFSRERGVDGVIITAATKSDEPIQQAASISRKRGRIILVGVTGLALSRADFYEKELSFQVSCSYGPGRYDHEYEAQGHDYPYPFVRWTLQRNFEAVLDMLAAKAIAVETFISHRYTLDNAKAAYALLSDTKEAKLGILLTYGEPTENDSFKITIPITPSQMRAVDAVRIGFIGAGNYASRILLPAFKQTDATFSMIACHGGISGTQMGKKFGFAEVTTDTNHLFLQTEINTVVIASKHDNHAQFICQALAQNKNVFVEKPLCLSLKELDSILALSEDANAPMLMVGFNRRFAPHSQKIKSLLATINEPKSFIMTVNALAIDPNHWIQNRKLGGGRIIGEACHFIDLLRFLAGAPITGYQVAKLNNVPIRDDKVTINLAFADGSSGIIHYFAHGHRAVPKERLEIFADGKIIQLDNFRKLRAFGWSRFNKMNLWRQDKGQVACVKQFIQAIKQNLPAPIPLHEIIEVSRITLEIANTD